jgi:hypothetical protein
MTASADYLDLVQATKSGSEVQHLIKDLLRYFNVEAIAEKDGCSRVECAYDESEILDSIREEFKKEFGRTKKVTVNQLIMGSANLLVYRRLPIL